MTPEPTCLLCGVSGRFRHLYVKSGYHIRRCLECQLVQLAPLPSPDVLDRLYRDEYFRSADGRSGYDDYASQQQEYLATFAEDVSRIARFVPRGTVLDVGCGFGYFLRVALAAGYDAYGVDLAEQAIHMARTVAPERVFQGTVGSAPELRGKRFDVIFASHLIEHICDPRAFVADLAGRLTEGGILVFVTPNIRSLLARSSGARWVSFKIPEHVAYYDPHTISRLFGTAGLTTIAVDSAYQFYKLPFVMKRLRQLTHPVSRLLPRIEQSRPFRDWIIRVTSGSLRAIARRGIA